jgi:hypothetical protein
VSRTSRAALVVFAAVIAVLGLFHLFAPQLMDSLRQAIHGR